MSVTQLRAIATARRSIGDRFAVTLRDVEQATRTAAISTSESVADALRALQEAGLPVDAGLSGLNRLSEASRLAIQAYTEVSLAHVDARRVADSHNIVFAGPPDCPDNTPGVPFTGA